MNVGLHTYYYISPIIMRNHYVLGVGLQYMKLLLLLNQKSTIVLDGNASIQQPRPTPETVDGYISILLTIIS